MNYRARSIDSAGPHTFCGIEGVACSLFRPEE